MSSSFERFLAGEDRLSTLLRELPRYEPGEILESRFAETARKAQAQHVEMPVFEPPASLTVNFQALAGSIDEAQQTRRNAVLHEIAEGKPVNAVIGAPLGEGGQKWLQQQVPTPAPQAKPRHKWFRLSWRDIQLVSLAAILAAWGTHFYLQRRPTSTETAMLEVFRQVSEATLDDDDQDEASSIAAKAEESFKANRQHYATPAEASMPAIPRTAKTRSASASPSRPLAGKIADKAAATIAPLQAPLAEHSTHPVAQAPDGSGVEHYAPANDDHSPEVSPQLASRLSMAPLQRNKALQKEADEPGRASTPAAPAPAQTPLAAVATATTSAPHVLTTTLREDPASVAARLPEDAPGTYTLSCENPEDPAVLAWVAGLRHALQSRNEKAHVTIQKTAGLGEDNLLIRFSSK